MRDWNPYIAEIRALKRQTYCWHPDVSEETRRELERFDQFMLSALSAVLEYEFDEMEKKRCVRNFFAVRWVAVERTSLDDTFNPMLASNKFYLKLAQDIKGNNESVCDVLMPSVKRIIGTVYPEESLLKGSCDDDTGEFRPCNYLTHQNSGALISLLTALELAENNTDRLFQGDDIQFLFPLTEADRERIRLIAGESSRFYFEALEKMHRIRYSQKPSVGNALRQLKNALLKSSKKESGSEMVANLAECNHSIHSFYKIWRGLSNKTRNIIKTLTANGSTISLESYLLSLFVSVGLDVSKKQFKQWERDDLVSCTHQIGEQLDTLLKDNLSVLSNIPLPCCKKNFENEELPEKNVLLALCEEFREALKTRLPTIGIDDARVIACHPMIEIISQTRFSSCIENRKLLDLSAHVRTVNDLANAMLLLNKLDRPFLSACLKDRLEDVFSGKHLATSAYAYLLSRLPKSEWTFFFKTFPYSLNGHGLGILLNKMPESQWLGLSHAMSNCLYDVFSRPFDVAHFFSVILFDQYKTVFRLFEKYIIACLNDSSENMLTIFLYSDVDYWPSLMALFYSKIIDKISKCPDFFDGIYSKEFSEERRFFFIEALSSHLCLSDVSISLIKAAFDLFPNRVEWNTSGLALLKLTKIDDMIMSVDIIADLFNQFPCSDWPTLYLIFKSPINCEISFVFDRNLVTLFEKMNNPGFMWKSLWELFLFRFDSFEKRTNFLKTALSYFSEENYKILMLQHILPYLKNGEISNLVIADILQWISTDRWHEAFELFLKNDLCLTTESHVAELFNAFPDQKWSAVYSGLMSKINALIKDSISFSIVASKISNNQLPIFCSVFHDKIAELSADPDFFCTMFRTAIPENVSSLLSALLPHYPNVILFEQVSDVIHRSNRELRASVVSTFGEERITNALLPEFATPTPTTIDAWKAIATTHRTKISHFFSSRFAWGLFLYITPPDIQISLVVLFEGFLKRELKKSNLLRDTLLLFPSDERGKYLEFLSPYLDSVISGDAHPVILANIFLALPLGVWNSVYSHYFGEDKIKRFFKTERDIVLFIEIFNKSSWECLFSFFHRVFEPILKDPIDMNAFFCAIPQQSWATLACALKPQLRVRFFEDSDFFFTLLLLFAPDEKIVFLSSVVNYFSELDWTIDFLVSFLEKIPQAQWRDIFLLLGSDRIAPLIDNEASLRIFLQKMKPDCLIACIESLLPQLRSFAIQSSALYQLLLDYPNCELAVLRLFQDQLAVLLMNFVSIFRLNEEFSIETPQQMRTVFQLLAEKALRLHRDNALAFGDDFFSSILPYCQPSVRMLSSAQPVVAAGFFSGQPHGENPLNALRQTSGTVLCVNP